MREDADVTIPAVIMPPVWFSRGYCRRRAFWAKGGWSSWAGMQWRNVVADGTLALPDGSKHSLDRACGAGAVSAIEKRLRQWNPTMVEYHAHPSISSGFLGAAHSQTGEGLSTALLERATASTGPRLTTSPKLVAGSLLHAWLEGDDTYRCKVAPPDVSVRRGAKWEAAKAEAIQGEYDALTLASHLDPLEAAWWSLVCPPESEETDAKRQIRAIAKRWRPRFPEVSHLWEPFDGCVCRIRLDLAALAPSGHWGAISIKTTDTPLTERRWWPFWSKWYRRSEAFYRAGLRDLFGETPFRQYLVVARTQPPYPWRLIDLETRGEELDELWHSDIMPELHTITEGLAVGHGPEERGIFHE